MPPAEARTAPHEVPASPWSLLIARPFGIPVRIHFTFLLLLLWIGFGARAAGRAVGPEIVFILLLFACVVLHELGHALMGRRFGVKTREIVLYPIGGIARLDDLPRGVPELLIALAGPAVNVVIVVLLGGLMWAFGIPVSRWAAPVMSDAGLVPKLFFTNFILVAFNMIPAFPMDGGRVLRALLSLATSDSTATRVAATIGQGIAILFGAAGLFGGGPILLLVALFVFLGAGQEVAFSTRRAVVEGHSVREAMITRFEVLAPDDSLGKAAQTLLETHQQDFPVIDAWGRVAGILPRAALLAGLARAGREGAVLDYMARDVESIPPATPLDEALRRLQSNPLVPVMVAEDGRVLGMVTLENLAEFIEVSRRTRKAGA